jgi:uncharacterized protein (TIGR02246 family)
MIDLPKRKRRWHQFSLCSLLIGIARLAAECTRSNVTAANRWSAIQPQVTAEIGDHMEQDEQDIRSLISTWLSASKAGDIDKVLSLMAEDVVFLIPGRPPMRGRSAFAAGQGAMSEFKFDGTSEVQEIKVFGEWAYCWTRLTVVVTPRKGSGPSVKRSGDTLSILKKHAGQWLLFRDANMLSVVNEKDPMVRDNLLLGLPAVGGNAVMQNEPPEAETLKRNRRCHQFRLRTMLTGATLLALLRRRA